MLQQLTYSESVEGVGADFERALVYPIEKLPEDTLPGRRHVGVHTCQIARLSIRCGLVVQQECGDGVVLKGFSKHTSARHGALPPVVASAQGYYDFWPVLDDVVQDLRIWSAGGLVAEGGREDDLGIFARFKGQLVYVVGEREEQVFLDDEAQQLEDGRGVDFRFCTLLGVCSRGGEAPGRAGECASTGCALQPDLQLLQVSCQLVFYLVAH